MSDPIGSPDHHRRSDRADDAHEADDPGIDPAAPGRTAAEPLGSEDDIEPNEPA